MGHISRRILTAVLAVAAVVGMQFPHAAQAQAVSAGTEYLISVWFFFFYVVGIALPMAFAAYSVAYRKERSHIGWFILVLIFPLWLVPLLMFRSLAEEETADDKPGAAGGGRAQIKPSPHALR